MGWNLDPLNLVIPFLIAARAMSHSIQLVERYYFELAQTNDSRHAARNAFDDLFRPGSLAIVVDTAGILVLALGAAPINTKMGYYAGFWAFSVVFTVLLVVPLLLLVLPQPRVAAVREGGYGMWSLRCSAWSAAVGDRSRCSSQARSSY
ncbi:hypothetical protein [Azoarcus sp. DN11]|uniref:hypothetical protein n=1 Tax=Azoarcus sp. DN11 TaxID=356837 RepID=UPI00256FAD8C|nr:hypothetical protein [Azoarcus sp. DN11]